MESNSDYTVQCFPLDSIEERFDVIKIDVEGSEADIWKGGQEYFRRNPDVIVVMEWSSRRYVAAPELAADMLSKCTITLIGAMGEEIPVTSVEQMLHYVEEVMLVLRFKK